MIKIIKPAVATSIQDQGRFGLRRRGFCRSGAMDGLSLLYVNRLLGNADSSAGIEFGPGHLSLQATRPCRIAFGGATRQGAPWWQPIKLAAGDACHLTGPIDGVWSYCVLSDGVEAEIRHSSRSTSVREEIGEWLVAGDTIEPVNAATVKASTIDTGPRIWTSIPRRPPSMRGPVRIFGSMPGRWIVGSRVDRMGYELGGSNLEPGGTDEYSEPLLPGCIQVMPTGVPIVMMVEGSTVGGYRIAATVHSEDLRLVAQTPIGREIEFVEL